MLPGLPRQIINAATDALPWPSDRARGRIIAAALVILTALLSFRSIEDLDYGIHLGTGRWILQHGKVPTYDPFTWSMPDHLYVAYHWGFQVLLAALYEILGHLGPVLLRFTLVLLTAGGLVWILATRRVNSTIAGVCGLLAIVATEWRFAMRPELFSNLFMVLTILCVDQWRAGARRALWFIPLIFVGWVNTHVYVLGFLVLGAAILEDLVHRRSVKPLITITAISAIAIFVNPYGIEAVLEPLRLFTRMNRDNLFAMNISELSSPLAALRDMTSSASLTQLPFTPINQLGSWLALLILGAISARELLRTRSYENLIIVATLGILSCVAMRNISLFGLAALPAITLGLTRFVSIREETFAALHRWTFSVLIVVATIISIRVTSGGWYAQQRRNTHMAPIVERATLGFGAAEFVESNKLVGRGFNNFNIGGSLLFAAPSHPIYIDGRNEVTGEEFFRYYLQLLDPNRFDPARFESFVQAREIEYIVLAHATAMHIVRQLLASEKWSIVYYDAVGVVFTRKDGPNGHLQAAPLAPPIQYEPERWNAISSMKLRPMLIDSFSRWLLGGEEVPTESDRVGTFLLTAGKWRESERYLLASVVSAPNFWETSNNLAALYWRFKHYEAATIMYRTLLMLNPSHKLAKERLKTIRVATAAQPTPTQPTPAQPTPAPPTEPTP